MKLQGKLKNYEQFGQNILCRPFLPSEPSISLPLPRMEAAAAPYPPSMAAELAQSFTLGGGTRNRDRRRHSPLEVAPFAASGVKLIGAQPTGELRRHRPSHSALNQHMILKWDNAP